MVNMAMKLPCYPRNARTGAKGTSVSQSECIFCKIVRGEIPCSKIYETGTVLGFLDIGPIRPGHALVIPKAHYPTILDLDPAVSADLTVAFKAVGAGIMEATGATGFNLGLNCNASAGQIVFHAHWHIIPRIEGDGLSMWPSGTYASMDEMNTMASNIKARIDARAAR